jgi:hypothetical protein
MAAFAFISLEPVSYTGHLYRVVKLVKGVYLTCKQLTSGNHHCAASEYVENDYYSSCSDKIARAARREGQNYGVSWCI